MILDRELRISQVGGPNWQRFLEDNPPQDLEAYNRAKQSVIARSVTEFFAGERVRSTFADLFKNVLSGTRQAIRLDYRCDAPKLRRDMRMSVSPITTAGEVNHLLYQSVMLSVQERPAIPLFGVPVADQETEDILTLCAICARVAWPISGPTAAREWIEPTEYYRRDGSDVTVISHGFCEDCFARLQEEA